MANWDPETGKLKPVWTVRFTPWVTLIGCFVAGVIAGFILVANLILGPGVDSFEGNGDIVSKMLPILGLVTIGFLLLGPVLSWGLGFMLRTQTNQTIHVMWFAFLGLIVGFMLGNVVGIGALLAPAAGIGAGVARWLISPYARI